MKKGCDFRRKRSGPSGRTGRVKPKKILRGLRVFLENAFEWDSHQTSQRREKAGTCRVTKFVKSDKP